jgi:hypothetical protein
MRGVERRLSPDGSRVQESVQESVHLAAIVAAIGLRAQGR